MLSKPEAGWTKVILGEDSYQASYLTDVPMDCILSAINSLKYGLPFCVDFDTEGDYFIVICSSYIYDDVEVIYYGERLELKTYHMTLKELVKEIYNDINNNLYDWSLWDYCGDEAEKKNDIYKNELAIKLDELKRLIDDKFKD